jgi:lambda family phage portal protein
MAFELSFGKFHLRIGASSAQTPGYEGASVKARARQFVASDVSPSRAVVTDAATLRARARQLVRNNPWASNAVEAWVTNCVGTGIRPRPQTKDTDLKRRILALWNRWITEADADGRLDFYGLQALITREQMEAGEILVRKRPRRLEDGLSVPLQLQVIEADHLPLTLTRQGLGQNIIRAGIEFDLIGKRTAYHLLRDHPGDASLTFRANTTSVVPAENILHVFKPLRAGQIRGVTGFAPVLMKLLDLDQYDDAEVVRKKTAALFAGFITSSLDEDSISSGDPGTASDDNLIDGQEGARRVDLEPGMLQLLDPGEDIKFSDPADVGGSYEAFMKMQLRAIASGLGVTYEQLSSDLSGVNFSSIRAGLIEFRRRCLMHQAQIVNTQFNQPVWKAWFRQAVLAGALDIGRADVDDPEISGVKWIGQGFEYVNPVQDQQAHLSANRAGYKSRSQIATEMGRDPEELEAEIAEEMARADALGLVFDSDPRKVAKSGAVQSMDLGGGQAQAGGQNG